MNKRRIYINKKGIALRIFSGIFCILVGIFGFIAWNKFPEILIPFAWISLGLLHLLLAFRSNLFPYVILEDEKITIKNTVLPYNKIIYKDSFKYFKIKNVIFGRCFYIYYNKNKAFKLYLNYVDKIDEIELSIFFEGFKGTDKK